MLVIDWWWTLFITSIHSFHLQQQLFTGNPIIFLIRFWLYRTEKPLQTMKQKWNFDQIERHNVVLKTLINRKKKNCKCLKLSFHSQSVYLHWLCFTYYKRYLHLISNKLVSGWDWILTKYLPKKALLYMPAFFLDSWSRKKQLYLWHFYAGFLWFWMWRLDTMHCSERMQCTWKWTWIKLQRLWFI